MAIEPFAQDAVQPAVFGCEEDLIDTRTGRAWHFDDSQGVVGQALALAPQGDAHRMTAQAAREVETHFQG
jgi:hypothetical protein